MASKTKVYFVLEFAAGGELLKKIVSSGARSETVDYCTQFSYELICDVLLMS